MNADLACLLAGLRDQPDDDVARFALADWCLEQPDPVTQARGEHVRVRPSADHAPHFFDADSGERL